MFRRITFLVLSTLAVLSAAPRAEAMSNTIEMQFSAERLRSMLQAQARHAMPCGPKATKLGACSKTSGDCYIDHVDLGTGVFQRHAAASVDVADNLSLSTNRVIYSQPFALHSKALSCIEDPNCPSNQYDEVFEQNALFGFEVKLKKGKKKKDGTKPPVKVELCAELVGIGVVGLMPEEIADVLPNKCFKMNLHKISSKIDAGDPTGAAVSLNEDGTRLALRVEYRPNHNGDQAYPQGRANKWQAFLDGAVGPEEAGSQFSATIHRTLLERMLRGRMEPKIAANEDIELDGPITFDWQPLSEGGRLGVHFESWVTTPVCPNDFSVDVDIDIYFSYDDATGNLNVDGEVDWTVDPGSTLLCAGLLAHTPISSFINVVAIGIVGAVYEPDLPSPSSKELECQQEDETFHCWMPLKVPSVPFVGGKKIKFDISAMKGTSQGLLFHGDVKTPGLPYRLQVHNFLLGQENPITYGVQGGCSSLHIGHEGSIEIEGVAKLCKVEFSDDPVFAYDTKKIGNGQLPMTYEVKAYPERFNALAYPYEITVWSTGGVETFALAPPKVPTAQQQSQANMDKMKAKIACLKAVDPGILEEADPGPFINPDPTKEISDGPFVRDLLDDFNPFVDVTKQPGPSLLDVHRELKDAGLKGLDLKSKGGFGGFKLH